MRRLLSNLFLARVQKSETQAGVPVGLPWIAVVISSVTQSAALGVPSQFSLLVAGGRTKLGIHHWTGALYGDCDAETGSFCFTYFEGHVGVVEHVSYVGICEGR